MKVFEQQEINEAAVKVGQRVEWFSTSRRAWKPNTVITYIERDENNSIVAIAFSDSMKVVSNRHNLTDIIIYELLDQDGKNAFFRNYGYESDRSVSYMKRAEWLEVAIRRGIFASVGTAKDMNDASDKWFEKTYG